MVAVDSVIKQPGSTSFSKQCEKMSRSAQKWGKHIKENALTYISTTIAIASLAYLSQYKCVVEAAPALNKSQLDFCSRLALLPQENNVTSALDAIENLQFSYEGSKFDF